MESFESELTTEELWTKFWGFISNPGNSGAIAAIIACMGLFATLYTVHEFNKQTELDQRAWIGLQGVDGFPKAGEELRVSPRYINTGKTMALHVRRQANWTILWHEDRFKPIWDGRHEPNVSGGYAVSNLVPNLPMTQHLHDPRRGNQISQRDYNWINEGDLVLYVYGRVCYDDIFQKPHWIHFCDFYNPDDNTYSSCEIYNEIDNGGNGTEETCPG